MARFWFGGTAADGVYTTYNFGGRKLLQLATATLTVWDAETGGTRYTDLLDSAGAPVAAVTTGLGQVPRFQGPDGVTEIWVDDGDTQRHRMTANLGATEDAVTAGRFNDPASQTRAAADALYGSRRSLPDPPSVPGAASLGLSSMLPAIADNIKHVRNNTSLFPVERACEPGGYGAVWTRDHGYVLFHQPRVFPAAQRRQFVTNRLATRSTTADADPDGGFLPADFIADRIDGNGTRTFKNAGASKLPFMDGIAFVVMSLWADWRETGDTTTFTTNRTVIDTCLAALPKSANGCVWSDPANPSVDYGFTDTVKKTGDVAYGTALLALAYRMLAEINGENGSGTYTTLFNTTVTGLRTLRRTSGWYKGSSGNNAAVDDVWATALIVAEGLCSASERYASAVALVSAYGKGEITGPASGGLGWVRHLRASQVWAGTTTTVGEYQNGGYWATPLWDCLRAAALVNPDVAFQWGQEAVREWNRQYAASGTNAPYEWVNGSARGTLKYAASAALLGRLAAPTTALRTATPVAASFTDTFATDTSASYTLSGFAYDAPLLAMKSTVNTDGAHVIRNSLSTADEGCLIEAQFSGANDWPGIILRFTDANNYIFCALGGTDNKSLGIYDRVAGVNTLLGTLVMNMAAPALVAGTYYTYRAWVVGTTVTFEFLDYTHTATTTIAAAGKVGARHGTTGTAFTAVRRMVGFQMNAGTLPADVALAGDNAVVMPGASLNKIFQPGYRLLDAKGRALGSGLADGPVSVA